MRVVAAVGIVCGLKVVVVLTIVGVGMMRVHAEAAAAGTSAEDLTSLLPPLEEVDCDLTRRVNAALSSLLCRRCSSTGSSTVRTTTSSSSSRCASAAGEVAK